MRQVIIGGSIAGLSAAKAIRGLSVDSEIIVISGEYTKPYYRPMIPFLIKEEIDITIDSDIFEQRRIDLLLGRAVSIDAGNKEILLDAGGRIGFDRLLIASGGSPVVPDIPGISSEGVFFLRTMEDAVRIRSFAAGKKDALVLGGGLAGLKAAIALRQRGMGVTVVEKFDHVLPGRLDRRGSEIVTRILKERGIETITGCSIAGIEGDSGGVKAAVLSSGGRVSADLIIIAVGARPNVEMLRGSGVRTENGVIVDEHLRTSVSGIYAAGDVVEHADIATGRSTVSGLWTNAEEMGRIAGKNMAGSALKYKGFLSVMNSAEFFGLPVMSIGLIEPEGNEYEVFTGDDIDGYRKLVLKGDILVGAVFIGEAVNAGIYTNVIRNRTPIGGLKEEAIRGNLRYINFIRTVPQALTV